MGRNIAPEPPTEEFAKDFVEYEDFQKFLRDCVPFDGYTVFESEGYWYGVKELSFVLEILSGHAVRGNVRQIAQKYKDRFSQDSVLYTCEEVDTEAV